MRGRRDSIIAQAPENHFQDFNAMEKPLKKFLLKLEGSLYGKSLGSAHVCVFINILAKIWMNKHKAHFSWIINTLDNPKMSYCELVEPQECILRHGTGCLLRPFPTLLLEFYAFHPGDSGTGGSVLSHCRWGNRRNCTLRNNLLGQIHVYMNDSTDVVSAVKQRGIEGVREECMNWRG